jgi:predicted metalloendopeptidase
MNKTRKIKDKIHLKKRNKSNEKYDEGTIGNIDNIDKITIDDKVGCVTVKNSFEENFENYFKNKKNARQLKKNAKYNTIGKELISAFKKPIAPKHVNPKDDFYTYVNYDWLKEKEKKHKKMKKYYTRVDSFRMLQEKVYYQLIDIVKAYTSEHSSHKSNMIRNVYESFLHLDEDSCERHWKKIRQELEDTFKNKTCTDLLIHMNRNEIMAGFCPISFSIITDEKDSQINRCHINAPFLSYYNDELYQDNEDNNDASEKNDEDDQYKKEFNKRFKMFVSNVFELAFGKEGDEKFDPQDVMDVEKQMLDAMNSYDPSIKEAEDGYNIVSAKDAHEKYHLNWDELTKGLGFKNAPRFFITDNLNYLHKITGILRENWNSKKWQTYFYYCFFKQMMQFHRTWRVTYFNFFGKFVKGQTIMWPQEIFPVFGLSYCFNTFLTEEYVNKYANGAYIKWASNLAYDLKTVFMRIIERNKWMSPKTKKYALLKLQHIRVDMAHPPYLVSDPDITYSKNDAWGNILACNAWRLNVLIETEGKHYIDLPMVDWSTYFSLAGNQAYIVNAFYDPTKNNIYLPLAYLQKPFLDGDERGIEYNLAYIGYTIGHELSHSLDDMGSMYDYKGNLFNWWTPHDHKIFQSKVNDVIHQYETFAARDGIKMDGSLSVGENLADISGLAIIQEYLRDYQITDNYIIPIKKLSFETLFMYIAYQWRSFVSKESIPTELKINPHPLDKYRANCPLARLDLFKSIYQIKKGDGMYWHSDTIW